MSKIPVNIISGFLGTGKTTTLRHLLRHKPSDECWVVLVNEYGEIGIDGAIVGDLDNDDDLLVKELPNGCICCSSGVMFKFTTLLLIRKYNPDRILVEPTGLATLNSIIDSFREVGLEHVTDLRSIITLIDPMKWIDREFREHQAYSDQVGAADILMATRGDLASEAAVEQFFAEAAEVYPPKRHLGRCEFGNLDLKLLDLVSDRKLATRDSVVHDHHHHHAEVGLNDDVPLEPGQRTHHDDDVYACGWLFSAEQTFEWKRLHAWLEGRFLPAGFMRIKGIFSTDQGWLIINATAAQYDFERTAYRRDSRVEILAPPGEEPNWQQAEDQLRACLLPGDD